MEGWRLGGLAGLQCRAPGRRRACGGAELAFLLSSRQGCWILKTTLTPESFLLHDPFQPEPSPLHSTFGGQIHSSPVRGTPPYQTPSCILQYTDRLPSPGPPLMHPPLEIVHEPDGGGQISALHIAPRPRRLLHRPNRCTIVVSNLSNPQHTFPHSAMKACPTHP